MRKLTEVDAERALKLRQRDARARALAMSCVAYAMNEEQGDDVPRDARHYAHDVATLATALLVSQIYLDDAELRALKEENEQLRKMTLEYTITHPPKSVILSKDMR